MALNRQNVGSSTALRCLIAIACIFFFVGNALGDSCSGMTEISGTSGVISDGSGSAPYLSQPNCTWFIKPDRPLDEENPTITVMLTEFRTVFGADALFFMDGTNFEFQGSQGSSRITIYGNPLAVFSGVVPTPHVMKFDAKDLRVQFLTEQFVLGDRESGFTFEWWTDGSCANDCNGQGTCLDGLCECATGFAGGDCSIEVKELPVDGTPVAGFLDIGSTDYYRIVVPDDGEDYYLRVDMDSQLSEGDPLLMIANATSPELWMKQYFSNPPQGGVSVGPCGVYPGCHWCESITSCDPGFPDSNISPLMSVGGPVTDYRTYGFIMDNAYPTPVHIRTMSLPSINFHTFSDYESWDLRRRYHTLFLSNKETDKTLLPPGEWYVGVYNAQQQKLAGFLPSSYWGSDPGFDGATGPALYELSAKLTTDINETCILGCSNHGTCVDGACVCDLTDSVHYVGSACEFEAAVLPPDIAFEAEPLPAGQWAYYYVPLSSIDLDKSFYAEIAFPGSASALPFLFVSKESSDIPGDEIECGRYWGTGPYGETHCEQTAFTADAEAIDNPLLANGVDYHYVAMPVEANFVADGDAENGFYVAVYNHPGYSGTPLNYFMNTKFVADSSISSGVSYPCPFDCSFQGTCLPPLELVPGAIGVCDCDEGFGGAYCFDEIASIAPGDSITASLSSGDWAYYKFTATESGSVLVELKKEADNLAKPAIFMKEGGPPSALNTYSSELFGYEILLDPETNGISWDDYTTSSSPGYEGNVLLDLSEIPPGSRIEGLSFKNLRLETVGSSWANEACLVFFTDTNSFTSATCLEPSISSPVPEGIILDGEGPRITQSIIVPDNGLFYAEIGEPYNDNFQAPDALLNGTLVIDYLAELSRGFDKEDATAIYCNQNDCAVDDYHKLSFDVEAGKSYYIGILNEKYITGNPDIDTVGDIGGLERFQEDLEYVLDLSLGSGSGSIPCYQDCNGRGGCFPDTAPLCICDEGYFGLACEIEPEALPVGSSADTVTPVSGIVPEGRFKHFKLELPEDSTSLIVTLTSYNQRSSPRLLAKKDGLPSFCESLQGVSPESCISDYDFATNADPQNAEFNKRLSTLTTKVYELIVTPNEDTALTGEKYNQTAGGDWYVSIFADVLGAVEDVSYTIEAYATEDIQCSTPDCNGNGICDTSVGLCKCIEIDGRNYGQKDCGAPIYIATPDVPITLDRPIPPGQAAFIEISVTCFGQDLIIVSDRPVTNSGAEYYLGLAAPGEEPVFAEGLQVGWEAANNTEFRFYEAEASSGSDGIIPNGAFTVNNIPPGDYTVGVFNFFESTDDLIDMTFTYSTRGSLAANDFNQCEDSNERLSLSILSDNGDEIDTFLGPKSGTTRNWKGGSGCDLLEAVYYYGSPCGTDELSCFFASNHTTYPSQTYQFMSETGHGNLTAGLAFGVAESGSQNSDYFYTTNSLLKQSGIASEMEDVDLDTVYYQAIAGTTQYDYEGCKELVNPEEVAGKLCIVVRGGCTFSLKTLNCQAAGAVGTIVVNSKVGQCAISMRESHAGELILTPSVMISLASGELIQENALLFESPAPEEMVDTESTKTPLSLLNDQDLIGAFKVASCEAADPCPKCGNGLFDFADAETATCTGFECPGRSPFGDDYFGQPYNCSGNGLGDFGGCTVSASGAACTCQPGFIGDDCSIPATPDCPATCTACQNCVRSYCFTPDCPFCADSLDSLDVGFESGMLPGCDPSCAPCFSV